MFSINIHRYVFLQGYFTCLNHIYINTQKVFGELGYLNSKDADEVVKCLILKSINFAICI